MFTHDHTGVARIETSVQIARRAPASLAVVPVANVRLMPGDDDYPYVGSVDGELSNPFSRPLSNSQIGVVLFDSAASVGPSF